MSTIFFCPTILTSKPFFSGDVEIIRIIVCQNLHNYLWFAYAESFFRRRDLMDRLGKHLIIELFDCDSRTISDLEAVEKHLIEAVRLSGATIIRSFFHLFPPDGVSGIVVVAESHFSIHTWPEYAYSALDIFTCGDRIKSKEALTYLKKHLKAGNSSTMELQRGPSGPALIQNVDSG